MIERTAKEIIAALPPRCYSVLLVDKRLIQIVAGETGYYPTSNLQMGLDAHNCTSTEELANALNDNMGVTRGQRAAMDHGSMWGWGCPAADPLNWNEDGTPIR